MEREYRQKIKEILAEIHVDEPHSIVATEVLLSLIVSAQEEVIGEYEVFEHVISKGLTGGEIIVRNELRKEQRQRVINNEQTY